MLAETMADLSVHPLVALASGAGGLGLFGVVVRWFMTTIDKKDATIKSVIDDTNAAQKLIMDTFSSRMAAADATFVKALELNTRHCDEQIDRVIRLSQSDEQIEKVVRLILQKRRGKEDAT